MDKSENLWVGLVLFLAAFLAVGGPHIVGLGFHVDDWGLLFLMREGLRAGRWDGFLSHNPAHLYRPLVLLTDAAQLSFFGIKPLYYHVVLLIVNVLASFGVYRLMRGFSVPRRVSILGAICLLAYPSKDTTLFWWAAYMCALSLAAYLAAYLSHLRYAREGSRFALVLSMAAILCSLMLYDSCIFLFPLFLITPDRSRADASRLRLSTAAAAAITLFAILYKTVIVPRFFGLAFKPIAFSLAHVVYVCITAINANLGPDQLICTGQAVIEAIKASPLVAVLALLFPAIAARLLKEEKGSSSADCRAKELVLLGVGLFVLGNAPIAVSSYVPSPTSLGDRLNLVPVLGIVVVGVGLSQMVWRRRLFPVAAGVAGVLLASSVGIAHFWEKAYTQELAVRDALLSHLAEWPKEDALVLHESALFVGNRAPAFYDREGFQGAVRLWTDDEERLAYVVRPGVEMLPDHLLIREDADCVTVKGGRVVLPPNPPPDTSIHYDRAVLLDMSTGRFITKATYADFAGLFVPPHLHNPFARWIRRLAKLSYEG